MYVMSNIFGVEQHQEQWKNNRSIVSRQLAWCITKTNFPHWNICSGLVARVVVRCCLYEKAGLYFTFTWRELALLEGVDMLAPTILILLFYIDSIVSASLPRRASPPLM